MTLFPWEVVITFATDLSSRPELSWADGLSKVKKNCLGPAITFYGTVALSFVIPRACDLIPISFKATSIEHVLFMVGLLSGNRGKVRFCTVPLAIECSILSVFGARSSVLLVQPGFS